jgi:hypothetical protein
VREGVQQFEDVWVASELAEELDLAQGGDGDPFAGVGDADLLDGDEAAGLVVVSGLEEGREEGGRVRVESFFSPFDVRSSVINISHFIPLFLFLLYLLVHGLVHDTEGSLAQGLALLVGVHF